jgi:hypothetical protein
MDDRDPHTPSPDAVLDLHGFYAYGYGGRVMHAVRAPFAMADAEQSLVGRAARIEGKLYRIVSVLRQIGGPVAAGEPIGLEIAPASTARHETARDRHDLLDGRLE